MRLSQAVMNKRPPPRERRPATTGRCTLLIVNRVDARPNFIASGAFCCIHVSLTARAPKPCWELRSASPAALVSTLLALSTHSQKEFCRRTKAWLQRLHVEQNGGYDMTTRALSLQIIGRQQMDEFAISLTTDDLQTVKVHAESCKTACDSENKIIKSTQATVASVSRDLTTGRIIPRLGMTPVAYFMALNKPNFLSCLF